MFAANPNPFSKKTIDELTTVNLKPKGLNKPQSNNALKQAAQSTTDVTASTTNRAQGWYVLDSDGNPQGGPYKNQAEMNTKFSEFRANKNYNTNGWTKKYWTGQKWSNTELNEAFIFLDEEAKWYVCYKDGKKDGPYDTKKEAKAALNKNGNRGDFSPKIKKLDEDRSVSDNAASLIERATSICQETWYTLTKTFNTHPEKYDPYQVDPSEKFVHFKLAPGGDARQDAYKKIIDETEKLCEKLNDALGRTLFVPEIVRQNGKLKTLAKYEESQTNSGIFKCESKDGDVGVVIHLTMPRQSVIRQAFKSLITTPEFPIGDDIPEPQDVMARDGEQQSPQPQMGNPQPQPNSQLQNKAPLSSDNFNKKASLNLNKESYIFENTYRGELKPGQKIKFTIEYDSSLEIGKFVGFENLSSQLTGRSERKAIVSVSGDEIMIDVFRIKEVKVDGNWVDYEDQEEAFSGPFTSQQEFVGGRQTNTSATGGTGYYIVWGSYLYSGGNWKPEDGPFNTPEEAQEVYQNKWLPLQKQKYRGKVDTGNEYKIRFWDQETQKWHKWENTWLTKQGNRNAPDDPDATDDAPISGSEVETNSPQNTEMDNNINSDSYVNRPKSPFDDKEDLPYRMRQFTKEEVAANAIGSGTINSGVASPDPYSDTRDAVKRKRTTEKANTTKMWKRAGMKEAYTLSGGPFNNAMKKSLKE